MASIPLKLKGSVFGCLTLFKKLDFNVLMGKIKHYVEAKKEEVEVNLIRGFRKVSG